MKNQEKIKNLEPDENGYIIILYEIKNPYTRLIKPVVPDEYIPQVKTGLCTIDICQLGLFCDCKIKICSLNDLNFSPNYSINFYKKSNGSNPDDFKYNKNVNGLSIIGLYSPIYEENKNNEKIDVGSLETKLQFEKFLENYTRKSFNISKPNEFKCFYFKNLYNPKNYSSYEFWKNEKDINFYSEEVIEKILNDYKKDFFEAFENFCKINNMKNLGVIC